jgi:hypothetical protein
MVLYQGKPPPWLLEVLLTMKMGPGGCHASRIAPNLELRSGYLDFRRPFTPPPTSSAHTLPISPCCWFYTHVQSSDEKYVLKSRRFTEIYPRWHLSEDLWSEVAREADAVDDMKSGFQFEE